MEDDSWMRTTAGDRDFFSVVEKTGSRRLFRLEDGYNELLREYNPDSVFRKYKLKCPLFRFALSEKPFVQFLLDCSERGINLDDTRNKLTCRNTFKCISKNKVKGVNGINSCHECPFFERGLVPPWERHNHPKEVME